jgi:hypothetical protein
MLINNGADVNHMNDESKTEMLTSINDYTEMDELLLDNGAVFRSHFSFLTPPER